LCVDDEAADDAAFSVQVFIVEIRSEKMRNENSTTQLILASNDTGTKNTVPLRPRRTHSTCMYFEFSRGRE
jgi:hypothetical protein